MSLIIKEFKTTMDADYIFSRLSLRTTGLFLKFNWRGRTYQIYSPLITFRKLTGTRKTINYESSHITFRYYSDLSSFLYQEYLNLSLINEESLAFIPMIFGINNELHYIDSREESFLYFTIDPFLLYESSSERFFVIARADKEFTTKTELVKEFMYYLRKFFTNESIYITPDFRPVPLIISPERIKLAAIYDKLKKVYNGRMFPIFMKFFFRNWVHPWKVFFEIMRLYSPETSFYLSLDGEILMGIGWDKIEIEPPNRSGNVNVLTDFKIEENFELRISNTPGSAGENRFTERARFFIDSKKLKSFKIQTVTEKKDLFSSMKMVKGIFQTPLKKETLLNALLMPFFINTGEVENRDNLKKLVSFTSSAGYPKWHIINMLGVGGKILNSSTIINLKADRTYLNFFLPAYTLGFNFDDTWLDLVKEGKSFFTSIMGRQKLYGIFTQDGEEVRIKKR